MTFVPPKRHTRPPKYATDPLNWEYDGINFDGRPRAKVPEDGTAPEKFLSPLPDPTESVVWQTAEWTDERTDGGPGNIYASFLDAVESFDERHNTFFGWEKSSDGEWNPRLVSEDPGEYEEATEHGSGVPRVIPTKVIPAKSRTLSISDLEF